MKTKNHLRVDKHRKLHGAENYKEKYKVLTFKYGIGSSQANKMKFWSVDRITEYLYTNSIHPTKEYLMSIEKEADRL